MTDAAFAIGEPVVKSSGYDFPGIIRAVFITSGGAVRYVVEHATSTGLLHIFNEGQLAAPQARVRADERERCGEVTDEMVDAARSRLSRAGYHEVGPIMMRDALTAAAKARVG